MRHSVDMLVVIDISKKDSSLRHTELLSFISPTITTWLTANCPQLMNDHHTHPLVLSVITHCNCMSDCSILLLSLVLLFHVALIAQRPIVIKLSRERSVGRSVFLSSALWKHGGSDPDAAWHHRLDGSRDEAGSGVLGSVHVKGYFWGQIWGTPL